MVIFHSYVSLPEGIWVILCEFLCFLAGTSHRISHWMILDKARNLMNRLNQPETSVMEMMQGDEVE